MCFYLVTGFGEFYWFYFALLGFVNFVITLCFWMLVEKKNVKLGKSGEIMSGRAWKKGRI